MTSGRPVTVGVDVGTTETKALVADLDGRTLAIGRRATAWRTRHDGGAEIDAPVLLDGVLGAVVDAVEQAEAQHGAVRVLGLGATGMGESGVVLRPDGSVPHPVIAWFDPRGTEEIAALDPAFAEAFPSRTGLPLTALPTFSKLLWLRRSADLRWDGARWLNVPEYVVAALGGTPCTEPSLASRTGLLEQDALVPYDDAFALLGAPRDLLPPLAAAGTPMGRADGAAPAALRGAVLTVVGHDHPVASLAAGALGEDDLFDSCGTAEALIRITERPISAEDRLRLSRQHITQGAHVLPGRRTLLGGTRGGLLLRRTLALLGAESEQARAALDARCPAGPVDLPVRVEGGRLDEQEVVLRIGADDVAPPLVWRAALDAVAEQAAALAAAFESVVGPPTRMVAAGGWTKLASYREVKSRTFPGIVFSDVEQAGALAAAAVAAFAADDVQEDLTAYLGERFLDVMP